MAWPTWISLWTLPVGDRSRSCTARGNAPSLAGDAVAGIGPDGRPSSKAWPTWSTATTTGPSSSSTTRPMGVKQETLEAYWAQLSIYADLIRQATGEYVSRLELVFCRPGDAVVVPAPFSR